MHRNLQVLLGVTCIAALGFMGVVASEMRRDTTQPQRVVIEDRPLTALERSEAAMCRVVRSANSNAAQRQQFAGLIQRNPHCFD